jgi:hypothetical protein
MGVETIDDFLEADFWGVTGACPVSALTGQVSLTISMNLEELPSMMIGAIEVPQKG